MNTEDWLRIITACGGHYEEIVVSETQMDESSPIEFSRDDKRFMQEALVQAEGAWCLNEVPVGAVVVHQGVVIGRGFNACLSQNDPSSHAEVLALRDAARHLHNYRLPECTLYVTLEPCAMCAGAIFQARIRRVIFGAFDLKSGAAGSALNLFENKKINHHTHIMGGLMQEECVKLLRSFFQKRRLENKNHA